MKKYQIMYYVGTAISLLVGLWHYTVPWMFDWASYIPMRRWWSPSIM